MIISTSAQIEGKQIAKTIGMVKGNTIRARHIGRDIMAGLRGIVGGEISEYTKMMAQAREEAIQRMVEDAEKQGANAIVSMRFTTSMIMQNASEILAYGTAVVLK
ncbi:MAG: heavy metal-binding domain-containing protein [Dehalococcoidia bacterium]|nr:heavy metal-binding domain-containing protein [Dehalococcoidia bacterium]